jgi:hypothetical protein
MSKIQELVDLCTVDGIVDYEMITRNIIDECMFAFLISVEAKFNPITAKNILLEHFELERENDELDF